MRAELSRFHQKLTSSSPSYLELLLKWNAKLNLTSIRTSDEILKRHFVESIFCAHQLPEGVKTLLDFGSGGGFPGVPIAICRPDIAVTLSESQGKKAAFLKRSGPDFGIESKRPWGPSRGIEVSFRCSYAPSSGKDGGGGLRGSRASSSGWLHGSYDRRSRCG